MLHYVLKMTIEQLAVFTAKDLVRIEVTCTTCGMAVVFPLNKGIENRTIYCPYCEDDAKDDSDESNVLWTAKEPSVDRELVRALMLAHKSNPRVKLVVKMPGG